MTFTSLLKGVRLKPKLPRFKIKKLSNINLKRKQLDIGFLILAIISILAVSRLTSAASAQSKETSAIPSYRIGGTIRTSDQSPANASIKISEQNNTIFESTGNGTFSTTLAGNKQYAISINQSGYEPISKECYLNKDTDIVFDLTKTPAPAVETPPAPVVTPAPKTSPKPAAKAPAAKPKTAYKKPPANSSTTPPAVRSDLSQAGVVDQINAQRKVNGLGSVSLNSQLNSAALAKAKHMADNNYFAHTAPDGTTDWYFVDQSEYKYSACGVNLAMGNFGTATSLIDAWMNSPGHKANILASFGKNIGIGIYGKYIVMVIAS